MIRYAIALFLFVKIVANEQYWFDDDQPEVYPNFVPHYPIRVDSVTGNIVTRGRFEVLGRSPLKVLNDPSKKYPLAKIKKTLQCAKYEPAISGERGIVELLKMLPPTKNITQHVCMRMETQCSTYTKCRDILNKAVAEGRCRNPNNWENLVRVINGTLYVDWPSCLSNPEKSGPFSSMTILTHHALDIVNDLKDSVFFVGAEKPKQAWNVPFPRLTNSPSFKLSDIPWPWIETLRTELSLYKHAVESKNFSQPHYGHPFAKQYLPWDQRTAKAAYFGEMLDIRQVFFNQALLRPDLIDARWKCEACYPQPWNPLSPELGLLNRTALEQPKIAYSKNQTEGYTVDRTTIGFLSALEPLRINVPYSAPVGAYKYLVVLTGIEGKAASGRLASMLAHSGAVILLQLSEFENHFSARLKPWVHYVPLTYSAADVVNKIEWLKAHDDLAQQIAINARNFGQSYLRLEDHFCYALTALETLAELEKGSDALEAFHPFELKF